MARVVCPAYPDPSNTADSLAQSNSRAVNEYLQSSAPGHARASVYPVRTPGVHPFTTFPDGPIRCLYGINGRMFAIGGALFGEVFEDGTIGTTHSVANDTRPAVMVSNGSNGHQIAMVSGNLGYIFDLTSGAFQQITASAFPYPARTIEFLGGYFVVMQGAGSTKFQWSALENGLSWASLDFAARSYAPDALGTLIRSHTELWVFGQNTTEVWRLDPSGGNQTFIPQSGVFIEQGVFSAFAACRADNTIVWLGQNEDGTRVVYRANGYTPWRVSTFAVEADLARGNLNADARLFTYQLRGHVFVHVLMPGLDTTWVYDVTMDRWHEWAVWNPVTTAYQPHPAGTHVEAFRKHLVGDRFNGTIYDLNQDFYDDMIVGAA